MLSEKIKQIYDDSNQIFGANKIRAILSDQGVAVSSEMVTELMREMNLFSIRTDAKRTYKKFGYERKHDFLKLNFSVDAPNQVWVSDITYFRLGQKIFYICAILDLYSRKIISYKISQKQSSQITTSTFKMAFIQRNPDKGLIFHSDRGVQYNSYSFQKMLKTYDVKQSFSPTGKPQHNAVIEAFFSSMKKEELYRRQYHSVDEFKKSVDKYMLFYNTKRPHSKSNHKTPSAYEDLFFNTLEKQAN